MPWLLRLLHRVVVAAAARQPIRKGTARSGSLPEALRPVLEHGLAAVFENGVPPLRGRFAPPIHQDGVNHGVRHPQSLQVHAAIVNDVIVNPKNVPPSQPAALPQGRPHERLNDALVRWRHDELHPLGVLGRQFRNPNVVRPEGVVLHNGRGLTVRVHARPERIVNQVLAVVGQEAFKFVVAVQVGLHALA